MSIDDHRPWKPAEYKPADAGALKALVAGQATDEQQQGALKFIVEVLCRHDEMSYFPDSDRDTAFAEGRRFVGNQIVKLLKINPETAKRTRSSHGRTDSSRSGYRRPS